MTYVKGDEAPRRGHARMKEIAEERGTAIQVWKTGLLASLGRTWSVSEEITAEAIASLFVQAGRVRDKGRDESEYLLQAALLMRDSAFRDPHAAVPATETKPD
jgi:hypothetical protein